MSTTRAMLAVRAGAAAILGAGLLMAACGDRFPGCKWCGSGGSGGVAGSGGSPNDAATGGSACSEPAPTTCPATVPSYTADIVPIVQQRCVGCHGPGGVEAALPLTTYEQMQARTFTTIQQHVRDCLMPPADSPTGQLDSAERKTLLTWLVCGAPDANGNLPDSGATIDATIGEGGIVPGPANHHCDLPDGSKLRQAIDPAVCSQPEEHDGATMDAFGDTNYGSEADDDDCKYHVKIAVTPVSVNHDVTFTVTITDTVNNQPVTGADLGDAEIYIEGTSHVAPYTAPVTTEGPPGTYTLSPVRFDQSARWTIRFHLFDSYCDQPASPHGHLAFYIDVP